MEAHNLQLISQNPDTSIGRWSKPAILSDEDTALLFLLEDRDI